MVLDRITSVNISDIVSEGSKVKIKVDVKDGKIVFPTQEEDIINRSNKSRCIYEPIRTYAMEVQNSTDKPGDRLRMLKTPQ